ncbi:hypothetical protein DBR47_15610 [Paucibacter sp. KBW04]|uniref:iron chaperone n=1 Tax=Paucibacter sp. KBW04 TaxID=2153361 RepID=UPI000F578C6F|nr:DUF1801 domain-containing protein [Paucibacter sp. KBW04]RQO57256.1 hypothetical protein DBR47_15610 [Paucibacter sp. KBW04]
MSTAQSSASAVDEYIAAFSADVQTKLTIIRREVRALAPQAVEKISYGIPTFSMRKNIFHYAAFKTHIGLYPGAAAMEAFAAELEGYKTSKGTIQVPLSQDPPLALIRKLVLYNLEHLAGRPPSQHKK